MEAMEYHIISGKVIETRRCYMPLRDRSIKIRGQRRAGATSERKIKANEREAARHLARILNTNFGEGMMLLTLKYPDDRLPKSYEELKDCGAKFLRKARATARTHTVEFRYCLVNANHNPRKDIPARFHHHCILPIEMYPYIAELWPEGEFHVKRVSNVGDLTPLANYLIANTHGLKSGEKKWSCSKGMEKPIYTEPKPVDDLDSIEPIPNTTVIEAKQYCDDEGSVMSSYLRAVYREPVKVRGGMIILPRKRKKQPMPVTLDMAAWEEE